mmetsp:Transcript_1813/g.1717  ORF Transcript_1813/g.1717 Transcript_1813/m.1717 type:complete len:404 (-) Transcript_1813:151-1362(-)
MSAFETLETLKDCAFEKTQCPICLSPLGTTVNSSSLGADPSTSVAMTSCGHFFCIGCLEEHVRSKITKHESVTCPNCRRSFSPSSEVIHIDHLHDDSKEEEKHRQAAKKEVQRLSHLLDNSNGIVDGSLWLALYLSLDVPFDSNNRSHPIYTAIPRDVLTHIRSATGMEVHCSRYDKPQDNVGLSSKLKSLLRDLPKGEHSVVFCSSKEGVIHIEYVLRDRRIRCFSLFSGQNPKASEEAVLTWETSDRDKDVRGPVLVVQSGAAASGLTLTVASKIFLMEPFSRQKEEQQAYARCHRYGQKNHVHIKIYYAPISVESRLLEWRKKASKTISQSSANTKVVFTDLYEDSDADISVDEKDDIMESHQGGDINTTNEDTHRTMFLLNLVDDYDNHFMQDRKRRNE